MIILELWFSTGGPGIPEGLPGVPQLNDVNESWLMLLKNLYISLTLESVKCLKS